MKKKRITIISVLLIVLLIASFLIGMVFRNRTMDEVEYTMDSSENILFLTDEFWESVTEFVFYDFDESIYKTSDNEKLDQIQQILTTMSYQEINNPWIEGWYLFEIQTDETAYSLGITSDIISFNGKFYKVTDSAGKEISSLMKGD